jgi:hypothetical protein
MAPLYLIYLLKIVDFHSYVSMLVYQRVNTNSWFYIMKSHHEIFRFVPAEASGDQGTGRQRQLKVVAGRGKGEGDTLRQRAI